MGTFKITNSELNTQFKFTNETVVVDGSFNKDAKTGDLKSINFSAYTKGEGDSFGDYIGSISGTPRDGEIAYTLGEMTRSKSKLVWAAIDEIEQNILPKAA